VRVAVARERRDGEQRVALVPDVLPKLAAVGIEAVVERGAGTAALFPDAEYEAKGARLVDSAVAALAEADVLCAVQPPSLEAAGLIPEHGGLVSMLQPATVPDLVRLLRDRYIASFSLELLPRISRAQTMDVLSSQATVSGYKAVLIAAGALPRYFPLMMTAAGTVPPAKVLVLGAGVAGLQAIATARRLGAVVRAYDVRSAARDEVKSLGATFVELELEAVEGEGGYAGEQSEEFLARQRALIGKEVALADVVITTAAIPGREAPILVTAEMVEQMAPGSVLVDLAAESGGNCELTRPGEIVMAGQVAVHGVSNLPSSMATHASFLFARNMAEFLTLVSINGEFSPDFGDEIVSSTCVTHEGTVRHLPTARLLEEFSK
jgi:NAD(P) transhydrogenase subunit alpha